MALPQTKTAYTDLQLGLDLTTSPVKAKPGMARLARNYECDENGNYRSLGGYAQIGGGAVPGEGGILGMHVFQNEVYAARTAVGGASVKLYKSDGPTAWAEVVPAAGSLPVATRYHFTHGTFTGLSTAEQLFIQAEGTGKPWQYDGTTLQEIAHANTPVGGHYLAVHRFHLVIGFAVGSLQISSIGDPEDWDATTGTAEEVGVSDTITGLVSSPGGVLTVLCDSSIQNLYGSSKSNWELRQHSRSGVKAHTAQSFGNSAKFLSDRGLTSLEAVQAYGDFSLGEWGRLVDPLFDNNPTIRDSAVLREKNQYWLLAGDNAAVICRFYDATTVGITTGFFAEQFERAASGLMSGVERLFMGDDAGFVYEMNSGTTFNGAAIVTTLVTHYNALNNDTLKKRFRRIYLDVRSGADLQLSVLPQFDYGVEEISRHLTIFKDVLAAGGSWSIDNWDEFAWSSPIIDQGKIDTAGTATNIGLVINSSSTTADPHTLVGYTTHYTPRRLTRG